MGIAKEIANTAKHIIGLSRQILLLRKKLLTKHRQTSIRQASLRDGNGIRYFDGKGNSWQLNYGYKNATDAIHGEPYLKATVGSEKIRIPLSK
ncbi:MAG: hypothetical protein RR710_09305 [Oscillospiraceae bacterium]